MEVKNKEMLGEIINIERAKTIKLIDAVKSIA